MFIVTLRQLKFNTVSHKSWSLFKVHYETFAFKNWCLRINVHHTYIQMILQ